MNAAFGYDDVISNLERDGQKTSASIDLYLNNNLVYRFFKLTKGVIILRRKVKRWTKETVDFSLFLSQALTYYKENYNQMVGMDLSEVIQKTQFSLSAYSKTLSMLEAKPDIGAFRYVPFNKLISKTEEVINQLYELLRKLKRANKKTPAPPSELAQQTAAYSMNNLSRVINAPR